MPPAELPKLRFGSVFGDVIHNLRCALDYIVTELAEKSDARPSEKRYFPVFMTEGVYDQPGTYRGNVLNKDGITPKKDGPLRGIKHGIELIEQQQPYHEQVDPRANPLWQIHRFSNADKHRAACTIIQIPHKGQVSVAPAERVVETWHPPGGLSWTSNQELEVGRVRFSPPFPLQAYAHAKVANPVVFQTEPISKDPLGLRINVKALERCCEHVGMIVDLFEAL